MSNIVFWLLIATVAIAPLPFASNRPLPWSVLSALVALLLILWGLDRIRAGLRHGATVMLATSAQTDGPMPPAPAAVVIDRFAVAFALAFGVLIAWYWFQTSSASALLAHPIWAETARALGEPLTGAIAMDPGTGGHQAMKLLAYGGVFFLAFTLCRDRRRARWAFIALTVVGLAYAAYGLFAVFAGFKTILGVYPSAYSRSVTSTFINRNSYATYGGLCVLAAMAPMLSELRHVMRSGASPLSLLRTVSEEATPVFYLSALAIATGIMAVILTGSRAGVASLLLGMLAFGIGMLVVRDLSIRAFLALICLGALCVAGAMMMSGGFLAERVTDGIEHDARWVLFEVGRQVAGERPLVGHGLGGFSAAFNGALRNSPGFDAYVDYAHNSYLELAVEGGIPALLLSLALVGMAVGACATGLFSRARGTSFIIAGLAAAAMVAGHSMFDFSLQMPAVAVTFMLMLGTAAAQALGSERVAREAKIVEEQPEPEKPRKKRRRRRSSTGRPTSADDSVTPPPEFDLPWMRPGATVAATGISQDFFQPAPQMPLAADRVSGTPPSDILPDVLQRRADPREGPLGPLFAPAAKHWGDADGVAPRTHTTVGEDEAIAAAGGTDSYRAALARWQTLRQAATVPVAAHSASGPGTPPPDMPTPRDTWSALGAAPSDDLVRATSEPLPPIADATAPQPPMPPAWPGESRRPTTEDSPSESDEPEEPPANVVRLPFSRRP